MSASEPTLKKADLIAAVEKRVPFREAQRMLREANFPTGRTWETTKEKIAAGSKRADYAALQDDYIGALIALDKSVAAYKVGSSQRADMLKAVNTLKLDSDAAFVKRFPYLLSQAGLKAVSRSSATPVAVRQLDFGSAILFSSVGVAEERTTLSAAGSKKGEALSRDRTIKVTEVLIHCYGALIVPTSGEFVWVCADYPEGSRADVPEHGHILIRNAVNAIFGGSALQKPTNLFPLVDALYKAKGEGVITSLSHVISTDSVKNERMKNGTCLREEKFHVAGMNAVGGNSSAFSIGVRWGTVEDIPSSDTDGSEEPFLDLLVRGDSRDAGSLSANVTSAVLKRAIDPTELKFVLDRIEKYTP